MNVTSVTPILFTETIEPSLPFWTEGLGFRVTTEVLEGDRLGFVILERNSPGGPDDSDGSDGSDGGCSIQVMLQTRDSVTADLPDLEQVVTEGRATLFLVVASVDDIEAAERALTPLGGEVAVPRRQTFYGADEIFFRSPEGAVIGLAAFPDAEKGDR